MEKDPFSYTRDSESVGIIIIEFGFVSMAGFGATPLGFCSTLSLWSLLSPQCSVTSGLFVYSLCKNVRLLVSNLFPTLSLVP